MSESLEFGGGDKARFNATRNAAPRSWAWAEDGRGVRRAYNAYYDKNVIKKGFFVVLWQVNLPKEYQDAKPIRTQRVRLQVESPTQEMDCVLNDLKWDVVQAILNSNVQQAVLDAGFRYDTKGLRKSEEAVRQNKTTTLFYVVLNDTQKHMEPEEQITTVHAALGSKVDEVVKQFTKRLENRFQYK